eukprot:740915-Lingulodinium_polyedra.AAC.1
MGRVWLSVMLAIARGEQQRDLRKQRGSVEPSSASQPAEVSMVPPFAVVPMASAPGPPVAPAGGSVPSAADAAGDL